MPGINVTLPNGQIVRVEGATNDLEARNRAIDAFREDFPEEYATWAANRPLGGVAENFARSFRRSAGSTPSGYGAVAEEVGAPEVVSRTLRDIGEYASGEDDRTLRQFEGATDLFRNFVRAPGETAAAALGTIGGTLAGGLVGPVAGAVVGGAAGGLPGAATGALVGGVAQGIGQSIAELEQGLVDEGVAPERARTLAVQLGGVIGAAEGGVTGAIVRRVIGNELRDAALDRIIQIAARTATRQGARRGAVALGQEAAGEMAGEGARQAVIATETDNPDVARRLDQVALEGIFGGIGSGAVGTVGGVREVGQARQALAARGLGPDGQPLPPPEAPPGEVFGPPRPQAPAEPTPITDVDEARRIIAEAQLTPPAGLTDEGLLALANDRQRATYRDALVEFRDGTVARFMGADQINRVAAPPNVEDPTKPREVQMDYTGGAPTLIRNVLNAQGEGLLDSDRFMLDQVAAIPLQAAGFESTALPKETRTQLSNYLDGLVASGYLEEAGKIGKKKAYRIALQPEAPRAAAPVEGNVTQAEVMARDALARINEYQANPLPEIRAALETIAKTAPDVNLRADVQRYLGLTNDNAVLEQRRRALVQNANLNEQQVIELQNIEQDISANSVKLAELVDSLEGRAQGTAIQLPAKGSWREPDGGREATPPEFSAQVGRSLPATENLTRDEQTFREQAEGLAEIARGLRDYGNTLMAPILSNPNAQIDEAQIANRINEQPQEAVEFLQTLAVGRKQGTPFFPPTIQQLARAQGIQLSPQTAIQLFMAGRTSGFLNRAGALARNPSPTPPRTDGTPPVNFAQSETLPQSERPRTAAEREVGIRGASRVFDRMVGSRGRLEFRNRLLVSELSEEVQKYAAELGITELDGVAIGDLAILSLANSEIDLNHLAVHEGFHVADYTGLITPNDRAILNAYRDRILKEIEKYLPPYAIETASENLAEMRAYGMNARVLYKANFGTVVNNIMDKVVQFVERIGNFLRGRGFTDWRQIYDQLYAGDFANRPLNIEPRIQQEVNFQPSTKQTLPNYFEDNPGGEWLKRKREEAAERKSPAYGAQTAMAGGREHNLWLPVSWLRTLPGANNEIRGGDDIKSQRLRESIKDKGWQKDDAGVVQIAVRYDGTPFIYEGNTRVALTPETALKVEIRWYNGAEQLPGPASPKNILSLIGNRGTFSADNPDIAFARAGTMPGTPAATTKVKAAIVDELTGPLRWFGSPIMTIGKVLPSMRGVADTMKQLYTRTNEMITEVESLLGPAYNLPPESVAKISRVWEQASRTRKPPNLTGLNPAERDALRQQMEATQKGLSFFIESAVISNFLPNPNQPPAQRARLEAFWQRNVDKHLWEIPDRELQAASPEGYREMQALERLRNPYYMPMVGRGSHFIAAYKRKPNGENGDLVALVAYEPLNMMQKLRKQNDPERAAIAQLRAEFPNASTHNVMTQGRQFTNDAQAANIRDNGDFIAQYLEKIRQDASMTGNSKVLQTVRDMTAQMDKAQIQRIFRPNNNILRALTPENESSYILDVMPQYVMSLAKVQAQRYTQDAYKDATKTLSPNDKAYWDNLRSYATTPTEAFGNVRALAFFQYLGFAIDTALINLTQNLHTNAILTRDGGVQGTRIFGDIAGKMALNTKAKSLLDPSGFVKEYMRKYADPAERVALERAMKQGIFAPVFTNESRSQFTIEGLRRAGLAKDSRKLYNFLTGMTRWAGMPMQMVEAYNRATAFTAAYKLATQNPAVIAKANQIDGTNYQNAYDYAVGKVLDTQYLTTKEDRALFQRFTPAAEVATQFLSYPFKTIEVYLMSARQALKGLTGGDPVLMKAGATNLLMMVGPLVALAGVFALPFADFGKEFAEDLIRLAWGTPVNFEIEMREQMGGGRLGEAAVNGVLGAYGIASLRRRLALDPVPYDSLMGFLGGTASTALFGPAGSMLQIPSNAYKYYQNGDYFAMTAAVMPRAAGNIIRGADVAITEDLRTMRGNRVITPETVAAAGQGAILPANISAGVRTALGFQPPEFAREREIVGMAEEINQATRSRSERISKELAGILVEMLEHQRNNRMDAATQASIRYGERLREITERELERPRHLQVMPQHSAILRRAYRDFHGIGSEEAAQTTGRRNAREEVLRQRALIDWRNQPN